MSTLTPMAALISPFLCLACASASAPPASAQAQPTVASDPGDTRMLEMPAVSAERLAFCYAGDLWTCNLDGGDVRRLTTHPGMEALPRFSPDGAWIAFSGEYDGNTDVYLVPAAGGEPRRLTWHPDPDVVDGFTPDGRNVVFESPRAVYTNRFRHLFTVPVTGGFPTRVPLPSCFGAAYSPDGRRIAYSPHRRAFEQWKNYRGGTASRLWVCELADLSVVQIPQPEGRCNDVDPMWIGDRFYFNSDRNGEFNLFAYDFRTKEVEQLTRYDDFPVLNASAGGGRIVYEQAGWLHLLDPQSGQDRRLRIGVAADLIETRPRFVSGEQYVRSGTISPSGARAAFDFRGEIVTLPAEKGDPRNLTNTVGAHERYPAWSPDGKTIAWFSDEGGENRLVLAPQDGKGERRALALGGAGFYEQPVWAPDGKKLAYVDNSQALYWIDVESGKVTKVDQEPIYRVFPGLPHAWSPDSRWLAYAIGTRTGFRQVRLHEIASGQTQSVTDGLSDASDPAFDANGKYLYLTASTDAGPFLSWFSQASADIERTNSLYVVVLARDEPSPFAPESDEEKGKEEKKEEEEKEENGEKKAEEEHSVRIDFEGLGQRILALPLPPAFYSSLEPGKDGQLYYLKAERNVFSGDSPRGALVRFDLKERKEKQLLDGVLGFAIAAGKEKVLVATEGGTFVRPLGDKIELGEGKLALDRVQVKIDPRAEWAQIFDEAWRINRDYFYDPGMHGADWNAMKEKYAQFLPHLAVRRDLTRVIRGLCSELAVGHSGTGGGDTLVAGKAVSGGLLGADYEIANGRYRFAKVYGGLNWTPDLRAPLTEPGVDVRAGEYLLAVEGRDLTAAESVYARFENTAGRRVEITVGPNPDGSGARTVTVMPIDNERALRNRDWVEGNIAKVTAATGGRVAYVYVPNTADLGHVYFKRYFFPQADREAIIVDERHNGGGSIADYYLDILRRPYIAHWAMRYGADLATPQATIFGPKVMITDETAGSGGDLLPWMFRKFGLGTIVGRPTWGGLVGILGFPELMDGGSVTAPNIGIWTADEGFTVENVGVPPDLEVEQWPAQVAQGRDPQLEKAIEVALAELARLPARPAQRPPFPQRAR
ncbi:MAG: peptidase S41 [Planctomycetota bacterium]|nr:MAG: peptidase S41 [Planctomycetota bacterium]